VSECAEEATTAAQTSRPVSAWSGRVLECTLGVVEPLLEVLAAALSKAATHDCHHDGDGDHDGHHPTGDSSGSGGGSPCVWVRAGALVGGQLARRPDASNLASAAPKGRLRVELLHVA
jgi:hypothetical protein